MTNPHMTETEWAQYIQTFEPTSQGEAETYLKDLSAYARGGNIECGIALSRAKRTSVDYPVLTTMPEFRRIDSMDRSHQSRGQNLFLQ